MGRKKFSWNTYLTLLVFSNTFDIVNLVQFIMIVAEYSNLNNPELIGMDKFSLDFHLASLKIFNNIHFI